VFVKDENLGSPTIDQAAQKLQHPDSFPFIDDLFSYFLDDDNTPVSLHAGKGWPTKDVPALLTAVTEARTKVTVCLWSFRLAFGFVRLVQAAKTDFDHRTAESGKSLLDMMSAALKGQLGRELKYLGTVIKYVPRSRFIC